MADNSVPKTATPAASDELIVAQDGTVLRLTLNRPTRRNALSRSLVQALGHAVAGIAAGGTTRVVVLDGAGAVFCAGGDIAEFSASEGGDRARADAEGLVDLLAAMTACPVPIVAQVHGAAYGGGVGLLCAADLVVAADGTAFSLSEARLGLVPAVVGPYVFAALGIREAKARMLLATPFSVDDALRSGLVHRAVPPGELTVATDEVVASLLRGAPGALAEIKRFPALVAGFDPATTRDAMAALLVERLGSDEAREGLRAFLEKRPATWVETR
jgi:methylglutaconyl-CoA hydratase